MHVAKQAPYRPTGPLLAWSTPDGFRVTRKKGGTERLASEPQPADRPYDLVGSYAVRSLISIALVGAVTGFLLTSFLEEQLIARDAQVSQELIQSVADVGSPERYFSWRDQAFEVDALEGFFERVTRLPEVLRANVYSVDGSVLWSSDAALRGKRFETNDELGDALNGNISYHRKNPGDLGKSEHVDLPRSEAGFIEYYVPVWDRARTKILGVVEIYKMPTQLARTLERASRLVWGIAIAGGLFLYATLFWVVRKGQAVIRAQQERLVTSETAAALGEMSMAVAHSIRNPLAAMRSSAELCLELNPPQAIRGCAEDVVSEADRLDGWVRQLLTLARIGAHEPESVDLCDFARSCLTGFERTLEKRDIALRLDVPEEPLSIRGDPALLTHMLNSVISNAIEAMSSGGEVRVGVRTTPGAQGAVLSVADSGSGIANAALVENRGSFTTTKRDGLGFGLAMAHRIAQRHGGRIEIRSEAGTGTVVSIHFPIEDTRAAPGHGH